MSQRFRVRYERIVVRSEEAVALIEARPGEDIATTAKALLREKELEWQLVAEDGDAPDVAEIAQAGPEDVVEPTK